MARADGGGRHAIVGSKVRVRLTLLHYFLCLSYLNIPSWIKRLWEAGCGVSSRHKLKATITGPVDSECWDTEDKTVPQSLSLRRGVRRNRRRCGRRIIVRDRGRKGIG